MRMPESVCKAAVMLNFGVLAVVAPANAAEDPAKTGASFNEVWKAVTDAPENYLTEAMKKDLRAYGTPGKPKLPRLSYPHNLLNSLKDGSLHAAAVQTFSSTDDYREYHRKPVHAHGICFAGEWKITEDSPYSGYFKRGSSALMIGRISTAPPITMHHSIIGRSFGFAGKIFPTANETERVRTANFFTIQDFVGTQDKQVVDVSFVNEPPEVDFKTLKGKPIKTINDVFEKVDRQPGVRPLYPISHAGQEEGTAVVTPKWMRIRVDPGWKSASAGAADFRAELTAKNYPNGLVFTVDVSDSTKDAKDDKGWRHIGQIRAKPMVTSFGCDRRLHFPHSKYDDPGK